MMNLLFLMALCACVYFSRSANKEVSYQKMFFKHWLAGFLLLSPLILTYYKPMVMFWALWFCWALPYALAWILVNRIFAALAEGEEVYDENGKD